MEYLLIRRIKTHNIHISVPSISELEEDKTFTLWKNTSDAEVSFFAQYQYFKTCTGIKDA